MEIPRLLLNLPGATAQLSGAEVNSDNGDYRLFCRVCGCETKGSIGQCIQTGGGFVALRLDHEDDCKLYLAMEAHQRGSKKLARKLIKQAQAEVARRAPMPETIQ
jgi:hypothetical protein